jgi:phospholipase A1
MMRALPIAAGLLALAKSSIAMADEAPVPPFVLAPPAAAAPSTPAERAEKLDVPLVSTPGSPQTTPGSEATQPVAPAASVQSPKEAVAAAAANTSTQHWYVQDPDAYSIVSAGHGLSLHKPMYLMPLTYSEDYHGSHSEVLFALSLKQRLFGIPLYFGYSQKSFFDAYDEHDSKPFRETDYNPELFYRWIPQDSERWHHLGLDFGVEHESNGQSLPDSRSWNRLYLSPFQAAGTHLFYWKWWWRFPENKDLPPTDPNRDDNPDIQSYYGYSELHVEQQLFGEHHHLAHAMFRYNPETGRGALNLQYSIPSPDGSYFWCFYLWQGYGESLIDYNHSITRVGLGVMLAR